MVQDFLSSSMAEGVGQSFVAVIDANTNETLYRTADDAKWREVAGLLGFEEAMFVADEVSEEEAIVLDYGIKVVSSRGRPKVFAEKKLLGTARRAMAISADGIPSAGAALFDDRVIILGSWATGEGCGAEVGGWFTMVPLTAPGPVAFQTRAAATRARRVYG